MVCDCAIRIPICLPTTRGADGVVEIDREGFETVGGYLLSHLGRVPAVGEKLEMDGLTVEVLDAERRRINKVRMCRKQSAAMDTEEAEVRSRSV